MTLERAVPQIKRDLEKSKDVLNTARPFKIFKIVKEDFKKSGNRPELDEWKYRGILLTSPVVPLNGGRFAT